MPMAAPAPPPLPIPVQEPGLRAWAPAGGASSVPQARNASPARQLWYAAVFPGLTEETELTASRLQRLAAHARQFTSLVSIEPPNALLLEIKGSLRLFGPLECLHAAIDACWRQLTVPACSATAPSTLAALWFARAGSRVLIEDPATLSGRLSSLPVACTAWDAERLQTLRAIGVTRIGELLRLPRAGLARRLGPAAVLDLDMALARQPAPRRAFVPRERFRERCDFEAEIEHVAELEQALQPLIDRCVRFLCERQAGVQALELRLWHRSAPTMRVRSGLAGITSERRRLTDVLAQRLTRLELAAPVRAIELISGFLRALPAASRDVFSGFGSAAGGDTAPQLVERLRARLGEAAVYGVCSIPEHRPEAAWRRVQALRLGASTAIAGHGDDQWTALRPVWLLDEPARLSKRKVLQLQQGALILEQGPERIESGWWDGRGVARDYYVARQVRGARLWVFQERRTKLWYLHGLFA